MALRWWTVGLACSLGLGCSDGDPPAGEVDAGEDVADVPALDVRDAPALDSMDVPSADAPAMDAPAVDVVDAPFRCTDNASCAGSAGGAVCDAATGRCVQCLATADTCPAGAYCVAATNACAPGCRNDEGCAAGPAGDAGAAPGRRCDTATRACVECVTDEHCPAGTLCTGNRCVVGCTAVRACPTGQTCCSGACVDPLANTSHCGACDRRCAPPRASAACTNGVCAVVACTAPYADCDGDAANGCETDTLGAVAHCGGCGAACAPRPNSVASCAAGACSYACAAGFADCDGAAANGCEVDLATSLSHCGRCRGACDLANATAACSGGVCAVAACTAGFGNCDSDASNGCETDTRTSATHCGACGTPCAARPNAVPTCAASACSRACVAGYGDCNGDPADGCETSLATSTAHCGACGRSCLASNVATATCAASACTLGACAPGFADCDRAAANGCELDARADLANCGACRRACAAGQTCAAGACATLASCAAIRAARPTLPSGSYPIDPDGAGPVVAFDVYCDMETSGGGWTLAMVKNSAHAGNYGNFGAAYTTVAALAGAPGAASASATAIAGWVDLNAFPYTAMRLAAYAAGARTYLSNDIRRSDLRIPFGQPGYYLYNDPSGYYWCGGPATYTDGGAGQVNPPPGAPADCKGHGSLGDGWDFGTPTVNQGLTLCGTNASNWMYGSYGTGRQYFYPATGAAYAIWVR